MLVSFDAVIVLGINDLKPISLSAISDKRFGSTLTNYSLNFSVIIFASFISILPIITFLGKASFLHFFSFFDDDFFQYSPFISYIILIYF